jgi:hypothetical protein
VNLSDYFESQGQAASILGVSVYDIREAKRAGCRAFRAGGRIRAVELQAWLKENRQENRPKNDSGDVVFEDDWNAHRDIVLWENLEFLHAVHATGQIDLVKYAKVGEATVELLIKLAEVWEVDAAGWRTIWERCLLDAMRKQNAANKRARAALKK